MRSATPAPEQTSAPSALPGEPRAANDTAIPALPPRLLSIIEGQIAKQRARLAALERERREILAELEELRAMREGPAPRKKPERRVVVDPALRESITEEELNDLLARPRGANVGR